MTWCWTQGGSARTRVEKLPYHESEILHVVNDTGVVKIRTWKEKAVEARWTEGARDDEEQPGVDFLRYEGKIFLIASSPGNSPVRMELRIPRKARLIVQGIDPSVTVRGVSGFVSARTLRGRIDIVDSTGPVVAFSRAGEIHYQVKKQPDRPAILLTGGANIYCHIPKTIQVRAEISTVSYAGNTQRIGHQPADCVARQNRRPCLRLVSHDQGRAYLYEGDKIASKSDGAARGGSDPPALRSPIPVISNGPRSGVNAAARAAEAVPMFRVDVDWVRLNLSVAERRSGRRIMGLGWDDFEVYEDSILQEIESLQGVDEPFHLLLLLDVSGSTASYLPVLRRAVGGFVRTLRPKDQLALAAFNAHPFLVQGFTDDQRLVKTALRKIPAGGGTGFFEALGFGLDLLTEVSGRKAMVVFTDGVDETLYGRFEQAADVTFPDVLAKLKETDALIYAISLDSRHVLYDLMAKGHAQPLVEPILREANAQLRLISDHSGTPLYSPTQPGELASIFDEIADDLKSRYTIAYKSNNPVKDGRWRKLTVKIPEHPEYAVQTRRGYVTGASRDAKASRQDR